jgi:predicted ArsR family transcriptional regulator
MSGAGELDGFAHELLVALRHEPLDVHQLAAELAVIPVAVTAELEGLIEFGLVHGVTVDSGRQAWGLTIRGRSFVARGGGQVEP